MSSNHWLHDDQTLRLLLLDTQPWLSCRGCFQLVDVFVESLIAGAHIADERMLVHLSGCSACAEEAAGLQTLVVADAGPA